MRPNRIFKTTETPLQSLPRNGPFKKMPPIATLSTQALGLSAPCRVVSVDIRPA